MALTLAQIQANITNKMDARLVINQIADYLEANPGGGAGVASIIAGTNVTLGGTATNPVINATGGSSYLSYVASLTQTGTDAPVPTLLGTPTIEDVTFFYDGATGSFYVSSPNFVAGKTIAFIQPNAAFSGNVFVAPAQALFDEVGYPAKIVYFTTLDQTLSGINGWGVPLPIEIRIYP